MIQSRATRSASSQPVPKIIEVLTGFPVKRSGSLPVAVAKGPITQLIDRCDAGDAEAKAEARDALFKHTMRELHMQAKNMLRRFPPAGTLLEPEDLIGEIYPRLFKLMSDKKIKNSNHFFALAFNNFRFVVLDTLKKARRKAAKARPLTEESQCIQGRSQTGFLTRMIRADDVQQLLQALDELPSKSRGVLERRLWLQMSFSEIAAELGEPLGTIAARYQRALDKVKRYFDAR